MSVPAWLLYTIIVEELALLAAFIWHRQWVDVLYWIGVLFINGTLLLRAKGVA